MQNTTRGSRKHEFTAIKQKHANQLANLYEELCVRDPYAFDQDDCRYCVIGRAVRHGYFEKAFKEVNKRPDIMHYIPDPREASTYTFSMAVDTLELPPNIRSFLFGSTDSITISARLLGIEKPRAFDVKAAKQRIIKVLDLAGYELV